MFEINKFLFNNPVDEGWLMNPGERAFFYYLLQNMNINTSVEIGRYKGGSTFPMAQYSKQCISIDPGLFVKEENPDYKNYSNLEIIKDYSWNVLPDIFIKNSDINLILVDGDHETDSVLKELNLILGYVPETYTIVLIHDTFYPTIRIAMNSIQWNEYKHVYFVDLDLIAGTRWEIGAMCKEDASINDISGIGRSGAYHLGFGMIVLMNTERDFDLEYFKSYQKVYDACCKKEPW